MRLSEDKIKQAILHPEPKVRLTALRYFIESYSLDSSIMPLVIEAVGRFGRSHAFSLLQPTDNLCQSPASVDWLISQLSGPFKSDDEDDNLRYTLALVLMGTQPEFLARRYNDIMALPAFPEPLKQPLRETMKLEFCDWPTLWAAFEELGRQTQGNDEATPAENRRFHRIVKAMSHHRDQGAEQVLTLLHRRYGGYDKELMVWLEPRLVALAGRMGLEAAVPLLLERLDDDCEAVRDEIGTALARIGGDTAVTAVVKGWDRADDYGRLMLIEPLECIHSDLALSAGLSLLQRVRNMELYSALAYSILGQFTTESIEPARRLLVARGKEGVPDYWDLRYRLIATATIMGVKFPEYQAWHDEALATDYGLKKMKGRLAPFRLADWFSEKNAPSAVGQVRSNHVYRLKITLREIEPPIWRRLLVPDCTLDDLHEMIQIAMGWENYHLYSFEIGGVEYTRPDMDEGELEMEDAGSTYLGDLITGKGLTFRYQYDFGDGWEHEVVVEDITQAQAGECYPQCVKGQRACPPEDVGGTDGYADYLEALADTGHERHEELLQWRGEFDPEAFDLDAVNQELRCID